MYNPGITTTVGSYAEAANSRIELIFVDTDVYTGQKFCSMDVTLPWGTLDQGFGGYVGDIITRSGTDRFYAMKILDINITNQSATLQVLSYARGLPANVGITNHSLPSISNPGSTINYDFELTNSSTINVNIRWLFASKVTIQTDTTYPIANSSEALPPTTYKKLGCWYDDWALGGACATGQTIIANGGTSHITGNFTLTSDTGKYENIALRIFVYVSNYWATGKHEYVEVGGNALLHQLLADYSHLECVSDVCTRVIGTGTNTCTTPGSTTECMSYTHNLDLIVQPWPWYTPNEATDAITQKIIDIDGAIINFFADYGIIDYTYIGTEIFTENDKVIIRIKLNEINTVTMGIPLLVQIAVLIAAILFVISFIGRISNYVFGGSNIALTNEELTSAGQEFMKNTMDGSVTACLSDTTTTQDQKIKCVKDQTDNLLKNWNNYQTDIYPDADHTPLDNGLTEIQLCYDTYNSSSKTSTDYQTYLDCTKIKREKAIDEDKDKTLEDYDPDATAGEKEAPSDLGKILLYGGVGLAGLYVLTRKK